MAINQSGYIQSQMFKKRAKPHEKLRILLDASLNQFVTWKIYGLFYKRASKVWNFIIQIRVSSVRAQVRYDTFLRANFGKQDFLKEKPKLPS